MDRDSEITPELAAVFAEGRRQQEEQARLRGYVERYHKHRKSQGGKKAWKTRKQNAKFEALIRENEKVERKRAKRKAKKKPILKVVESKLEGDFK